MKQEEHNFNNSTPRTRPPMTPDQHRSAARHRRQLAQQRRRRRNLIIGVTVLALLLLAGVIVKLATPSDPKPAPQTTSTETVPSVSAPQPSAVPTAQPTPVPTPEPSANPDDAWQLRLVNASNPLPDDFTVELTDLPNGKQFDTRAVGALEQMLADGNAQGLSLMVCSAYRSIERQDYLFNSMLQDYISQGYSESEAYNITATIRTPHGCSEHSSGLSADIVSVNYQTLDDGFGDTPEGKWLAEHAVEYGFILRYPAGKQEVTGIIYEPWHFRYVGTENAQKIKDSGLCLEEYLAQNS